MPRLSNYRPQRGNDYKFIDKTVFEMFQVGGTDVFFHKYIGPADPVNPDKATSPTTIQDVLFLENRDRKYDKTVYVLRGVYNVSDIDFNLSQFGLFLLNDTVFMTIHINNSIEVLGRKVMAGDVVELPHLIDDFALNNFAMSLKRYYVVEDVNRAAEGFSVTWYPHLYRLKLKPLVDSQEFKDILDMPADQDKFAGDYDASKTYYPGQIIKSAGQLYTVTAQCTGINPPNDAYYSANDAGNNLRDLMSTYSVENQINNAVVAEAEANSPQAGYAIQSFYTLALDDKGNKAIISADRTDYDSTMLNTVDTINPSPLKEGYKGYLLGAGIPPNGIPYGFGIAFPKEAASGDFFLRTDYLPNRLFRYDGVRWVYFEQNIKMTLTNTDTRDNQKASFINNTNLTGLNPLSRDTIVAKIGHLFDTTRPTAGLDMTNSVILTRTPFSTKYHVKVTVNKTFMPTKGIYNSAGYCAFQTEFVLLEGDLINWTIYSDSIPERQSLSKALLPTADFK